jgi:hypothetical protein
MPEHDPGERTLEALDAALAGRPVPPDLTELGGLAVLVRDERPLPPPAFAAALDARAADGFPRPRRRRAPGLQVMGPALAAAACLLLVAGLVAVPRLGSDGDRQASGGGGASGTALDRESAPQPGPLASPPAPPGGSPRSDSVGRRRVEHSAALTLAARPAELEDVADGVVRVTDAAGGFVQSSSVTSGRRSASGGEFILRIPASGLQAALADLSRLAHVRERSQRTLDITRLSVSARDRLADARAERASLRRRLARADTDQEAARLRAQLRRASRRVAVAGRDVARADNRARFATVTVSLVADRSAAAPGDGGRWTPADALGDAVRVLEVAAGVAVVALAVALPLGLLGGGAWVATRHGVRRRRERALDAI